MGDSLIADDDPFGDDGGAPEITPARLKDAAGVSYNSSKHTMHSALILREAGEMSLVGKNQQETQARLTVSSQHGKAVTLRLYKKGNKCFIEVKRLRFKGRKGLIELRGNVEITPVQYKMLLVITEGEELRALSKMSLDERYSTAGIGGSCWTLEYFADGKLQIIDLYSARPLQADPVALSENLTKQGMDSFLLFFKRAFDLVGVNNPYVNKDRRNTQPK